MTTLPPPPVFATLEEHLKRMSDVDLWHPYVTEALRHHDLADRADDITPGYNATYPTFVCGDVAVKLFGGIPSATAHQAAECAAHRLIATDPEIAAPRLLGEGRLFEDPDAPWPYMITSLMRGVASWRVDLSGEQSRSLAVALGRQVRRIHDLPPSGVATDDDWPALDVVGAAERSSLPPHLIAQVDDYVKRLGPFDPVFVHSDIVANHVYVENGEFTGIIDWGDAMVTDRHVEIIQIYRDTFRCDGSLLRVFLDACSWPEDGDFPRQALGHALRRQAIGMLQHGRIDVFMPVAETYPLDDIATLDELATVLFDV